MKTLLASLSPRKAEIAICLFPTLISEVTSPGLSLGSGFTNKSSTAKYTTKMMIY